MYFKFLESSDELADGINAALYREHLADMRHIYTIAYRLNRPRNQSAEYCEREFLKRFPARYLYINAMARQSAVNRPDPMYDQTTR